MNRTSAGFVFFLGILAVATVCTTDVLGQPIMSDDVDIARLMDIAQSRFDLSNEDAVILYDGRMVVWSQNGLLSNHFHRIIWINTSHGIEEYGDHRIPYDHAGCHMRIRSIGTFRDSVWWQTGSTGRVETLPFEIEHAYDYTNMREMMLLHDGIELPCILDVSYEIEDTMPFRRGTEGMWLFNRENPVVRSTLLFSVPKGSAHKFVASEGVPSPRVLGEDEKDYIGYEWSMGPLEAIPRPETVDPAAYLPHVSWSTWSSWSEFGADILSVFEPAMEIDDVLRHCLDSIMGIARTERETADLIAEFVDNTTRFIDYPEHNWFWSPRAASRTYATAYGHRLDRAVLAAALFKEAGFDVCPMFTGSGYGEIDEGVPTVARMDGAGVRISIDGILCYYDPESSSVTGISPGLLRRSVWVVRPDDDSGPEIVGGNLQTSRFDIRIDLRFYPDSGTFSGSGCLTADGCFNPLAEAQGLSDEMKSYVETAVSSVIDGATITACSPSRFDELAVVLGFDVELRDLEPDDFDRIPLLIGEPSEGIARILPDDVRVYHQRRLSPVRLPTPVSQSVEIRVSTEGLRTAYLPPGMNLNNVAGEFTTSTTLKDDQVIIGRTLSLKRATYEAAEWSDLRSLLLAGRHDRNRTLLFRAAEDAEGEDINDAVGGR